MERTKKSETKRTEIIAAVRHTLPEMDYRRLSVRAICDLCGISIGSFYHHFKNKEDLLTEILEEIDQYLTQEVQPHLTLASASENLMCYALGFASETTASALGAGGSVLSTASVPLPSDPAAREKERNRPLYAIPRTLILDGQSRGEFASDLDADATAAILVTTLRGYAMDWARRSFSYDFPAAIRSYMEFFLRGLTGTSRL